MTFCSILVSWQLRKLASKIVLHQTVSQDSKICLLFSWFCKETVQELNRLNTLYGNCYLLAKGPSGW